MEKENNKTDIKIIETYAEDMARVIEDDEGGLIKKIIHEQEIKEKVKINLSPQSQKNRIYMFTSLTFVVLALFTFIYFVSRKYNSSLEVAPQFVPLIYNDKNFFIETNDLTKDKIIWSILTEANRSTVKSGGLEGIYLTKDQVFVGLREFISMIKGNLTLPDEVFVSDNFLLGVVNNDTKDLFFLIKVRSFPDTFHMMKTWENKMFYDLHSFFGVLVNDKTNYLLTRNFSDGIVENKNARILYDKDGKIIMMYLFADDNSIVIANKAEAVHEIIFRLSSSQLKK